MILKLTEIAISKQYLYLYGIMYPNPHTMDFFVILET